MGNITSKVMAVCVAAALFTTAGCKAGDSMHDTTTAPTPTSSASSAEVPEGYDEYANWSRGVTDPELEAIANEVGLIELTYPKDEYADMGYVAVGLLESKCMVALSTYGASGERLSVVVLSRHDLSFEAGKNDTTRDEAAEFFADFRALCAGETTEFPLESSPPASLDA